MYNFDFIIDAKLRLICDYLKQKTPEAWASSVFHRKY
jgi:hypothetical protein